MSFVDVVRYRLRAVFLPGAHARDMDRELRHHLDLEAMDARATARDSISEKEIQFRARRDFGNATWYTEERRMIAGISVFDALRQDIAFVGRLLRRRATFAAVTIATMALGIGAATSIYSVADAVLFRPLSFPDANHLATVWLNRTNWKQNPSLAKRWNRGTVLWPAYREWSAQQQTFSDVAVWTTNQALAGEAGATEEVTVGYSSASLAHVLGIHMEHGAWFTDDAAGAEPVAVMSHETWAVRFGGDSTIVGHTVPINGQNYRITGIAPQGLTLDRSSTVVSYWMSAGRDSSNRNVETSSSFQAIGRLKPTQSLQAAASEARAFFPRMMKDDRIDGATVTLLHDDQTRNVRRPLLILLSAALLLLLIACINIATLLLGEATRRQVELRTRAALGAGHARLLRQLLTESVVLATTGAIAGIALAYAATQLIVRAAPPGTPGLGDVEVNVRVLFVALGVAIATGLLFGLAPALSLARSSQSLALGGTKHTLRGRGRGQRALIATEVALSMVLLVCAGLLVRSFDKLSAVGFRPAGLAVVNIRRSGSFGDSVKTRAFYAAVIARLRNQPGISDIAATTTPPFSTGSSSGSFEVEGRVPVPGRQPLTSAERRATTPDFFRTAGIPVVDGRAFTEDDRDGTNLVMVINRTMARAEWPGQNAVGKRVKFGGIWRTIVGVVGDIETERPSADPPETIYVPVAQMMLRGALSLMVRVNDGAPVPLNAIRQAVHDAENAAVVSRVDLMSTMVARSLADDRLRTTLIALFAIVAAVLAMVGTYGVASTAAASRTREMAIRVAVGASSASIARLIVAGAAAGVAAGALGGVGLAFAGARILSPYLYGVRATDPLVYASVAVLFATTTLAATFIPARRAMNVRVTDTLSAE